MNTTIETKRLIAKFMNYANNRPLADGLLKSLYNDWNSLIPVVEKIKSLNVPYGWGYHNAICASLIDCNFEETYKYCFEFIERYFLETNK